ncbi:unnamed protein product [Lactuca virosa]|uniref:Metacaspase-1-like n=1 Tax=Lactuca virosa TaxID=75947 RepID=A0AAU9LSF6_9ASTR|nr:unnamed protein product [Lactuca virosa]
MQNQNLPNFLYDRIPKIQAMSMLVDCPNCRTTLNLPEGARSIRCSVCQTVTKIADTVVPSLRPSPFADVTGYAPSPSPYTNAPPYPYGVSPFPGLAAHVPSPYNNAPSSPSAVTAYPGLVPHMPSPSHLSYSPPSVYGRKKAVIVGVSYKNTSHELKGCLNDAKYMKYLLIKTFQFPESSIRMLTEEETDSSRIPTARNMRTALSWLIEGCQPGDSLVFHFSGHGSRQRNLNGDELDGYDETLCPLDFETEGMIIDDEINATIVRPLPLGAKLHAIIDSCHSGTVLDLPFLCRMNSSGHYEWEDHRPTAPGIYKGSNGGEVISISGCDDDQTSADTSALSKITSTGAMTFCFIEAIEHGNASTYGSLLSSMRNTIRNASRGFGSANSVHDMLSSNRGFTQEPQLTSCEPFDVYAKPFSF